MKQSARTILEGIVGQTLVVIAGSAGTLAILTKSGKLWSWLDAARWPISIAISALIGIGILFIGKTWRRPYRYRYPSVNFRYEIMERRTTYKVRADRSLHYSRHLKVKATQGPIDDFIDRYLWTGGPTQGPIAGNHVQKIELLDERAGIWQYFRVIFDRTLQKGDEYEFEVNWPPIDNWRKSRPFVSTSTEEPTRKLIFEIEIPLGDLANNRAHCEKMRAVESLSPFETEDKIFNDQGKITWEVPWPRLYHHYKVRWAWKRPATPPAGIPAHGGGQDTAEVADRQ